MEVEFPRIRAEARKAGADIYFRDEASIRSVYHSSTTWAPAGQTLLVQSTGACFGINMISAVSPRGLLRFKTFEGKFTGKTFIAFLKCLMHNAGNPIYLILDRHPAHMGRQVKEFVDATEGKLHLLMLPPFPSELNPSVQVWNNIENHKLGRSKITGPNDLFMKLISALHALQKTPAKIAGFFLEKQVHYIRADTSGA